MPRETLTPAARDSATTSPDMILIVGLGNPGGEYGSHRHNVGFMAVDALARRVSTECFRNGFSGVYVKADVANASCLLLKPMTFMNDSGRSVQAAIAFFKVAAIDMVVLHDELDLPFGDIRLKRGGGHAGHNGLRSIMRCVGTGAFGRARIGIGRPPLGFRGQVADFVLSGFSGLERAMLPEVLERAVDTVVDVAARGLTATMNARNTKARSPKKPDPAPAPSGV
jgi:PTH1 family peptidyl-tRNA hydrolase